MLRWNWSEPEGITLHKLLPKKKKPITFREVTELVESFEKATNGDKKPVSTH